MIEITESRKGTDLRRHGYGHERSGGGRLGMSVARAGGLVGGFVVLSGLLSAGAALASASSSSSRETRTAPASKVALAPSGEKNAPVCGQNWAIVPSVDPQPIDNTLGAVAVVSANDVWAVGRYAPGYSTRYETLIEHWNGASWSVVPSPNGGTATDDNYLDAVSAVSAGDVWAVGYYVDSNAVRHTLTEHWNGTAWSVVASPNQGTEQNSLSGVAVVSANEAWAVGYYDAYDPYVGDARYTLVEYWNGSGWYIIPSPSPGYGESTLYAIAAISASDVWAVGSYWNGGHQEERTLTEHWNGTAWSVVTSPNVSSYNFLYGVSAVSATDVWAVGRYNTGNVRHTLTEHWNGTAWSIVASPDPGTDDNEFYGVAAVSAGDVWAVGYYWSCCTGSDQTLIEHWNGTAWSVVPGANQPSFGNELDGVAAVSASDVWAVGYYGDSYTNQTLIERYNPCPPTPTPTPTPCAPGQFSDVPSGSTFYPFVSCLVSRNIISGYSDCTFRPNNNVTRGQIAKMVSNAAGFTDDVTGRQTYADVPSSNSFWLWIERLSLHEVMSGYACGGTGEPCDQQQRPYFRWSNNATRAQLSKIVSNAAGYQENHTEQTFADVATASPFYQYIERLASRSVMSGYVCGGTGEPCIPPDNRPYFRPNNNVTRGQASKIVANTFFPSCQTP